MSKDNLLNEGTVRRFMKLAEIHPLASDFVKENFTEEEQLEEMGGDMPVYQDDDEPEMEAPVEADVDLDMEPEAADDELDVEMDLEPEVDAAEGELTLTDEEAEVFLKVADKVRAAMEAAPEPEDVDAPDMGVEDAEVEMDVEMPEEPEDEEELAEVVDDEALVNEVAARVAKRLLTKNKK